MEILSVVFGAIIGAAVAFLFTAIADWSKARKEYEKERFDKLFNAFVVLRNRIHKGAAYDFSDLEEHHQEELQNLLNENMSYADDSLSLCIHLLITSDDSEELNQVYSTISDIIYGEHDRFRHKMYWNKITREIYRVRSKKIKKNLIRGNMPEYAAKKIYYEDVVFPRVSKK